MIPKIKVLIVDDEAQIRKLVRIGLESQDFSVVEASSGREAIQHALSYLPDVVILDLGLPDTNGVKVLEELRKWSSVPVVILSVQDDEDEKVNALDQGADDYVTKPFSMN